MLSFCPMRRAFAISVLFSYLSLLSAQASSADLSVAVLPAAVGVEDREVRDVARTISDAIAFFSTYRVMPFEEALATARKVGEISQWRCDDEVSREIVAAKEAYFNFRYDDAGSRLEGVIGKIESGRDECAEFGAHLEDAYLTYAQVLAAKGRDEAAVRNVMGRAIRNNPSLVVPESEYQPSIVKAYEEVRAELAVATAPPHPSRKKAATPTVQDSARAQMSAWLGYADALRVDEVVIIGMGRARGRGRYIDARIVDGRRRTSHRPISVKFDEGRLSAAEATLAERLVVAMREGADMHKARFVKSPYFWGVVGTAAVGAVVGGILASMSSGGRKTGNIRLELR